MAKQAKPILIDNELPINNANADFFYHTDENRLYFYNRDTKEWVLISGGGSSGGGSGGGSGGITQSQVSQLISQAISDHEIDTTNVHGVQNTSSLLTITTAPQTFLTINSAVETYLDKNSASNIYLTQDSASSIYLDKNSASFIYLDKNSASSTYLDIFSASTIYLSKDLASAIYITINSASALVSNSASTTQTLTNKTLSNPVINSPISTTTLSTKTASPPYIITINDRDTIIEVASGGSVSIPLESIQPFPIGSTLSILQSSSAQVMITAESGVTLNGTPGFKIRSQWALATLIKRGSNAWVVMGDLVA